MAVGGLCQRIAGKSIPFEVSNFLSATSSLTADRHRNLSLAPAHKFQSQGNRLALPALELSYLFLAIAQAPLRCCLPSKHSSPNWQSTRKTLQNTRMGTGIGTTIVWQGFFSRG